MQIDGFTEEISGLEPLVEKYQAFGCETEEIDGHDFQQLISVLVKKNKEERPKVIIAKTIRGKGVSFMEGNIHYHAKKLTEEGYKEALEELSK